MPDNHAEFLQDELYEMLNGLFDCDSDTIFYGANGHQHTAPVTVDEDGSLIIHTNDGDYRARIIVERVKSDV